MARQNLGKDLQSRLLGGDVAPTNSSARQPFGTATSAPGATTLTDTGRTWTTNEWVGHVVASGNVYGVIASNTATVLTVDRWYNPSDPGGAAGTTPSNGDKYVILPGGAPPRWMGVTETAGTSVTDTALTGELTGNGWTRALCTYAHTTNTTSYTLTHTFTSADPSSRTLQTLGIFDSASGGIMMFETAITSPPVMVSGDTVTITDTVSI